MRLVHLASLGSVLLLLGLILPALILSRLEPDWTRLDALYFVFISVTTIGLGDLIPGDHPHMAAYKVLLWNYLENLNKFFDL